MGATLKATGNTRSEMVIFPDMPHAFYADYRPSYRKEAADDGWKRLTAWFANICRSAELAACYAERAMRAHDCAPFAFNV